MAFTAQTAVKAIFLLHIIPLYDKLRQGDKMDIIKTLTEEFSLKPFQVENTVKLIDDGNTIPFIARYRKEATGSLDDQVLRSLYERLNYLRNMEETRQKIKTAIDEQGALTDELSAAIDGAKTLTELDDLYRPYKKNRKRKRS